MQSSKPLFRAGELIVCPNCNKAQVQLTVDLYVGQTFSHEYFVTPPDSLYKPYYKAPAISYCCGLAFLLNGALFVFKRGWVPYNPFGSEHSRTEQDRYLDRKKTFI